MEAEAKSTLWPLVKLFLRLFHPSVFSIDLLWSRMGGDGMDRNWLWPLVRIERKLQIDICHFREEVRSDDFFWNRMAFMYCLKQVIHLLISYLTGFTWMMHPLCLILCEDASQKANVHCAGSWLCRSYWGVCWGTIQVCRRTIIRILNSLLFRSVADDVAAAIVSHWNGDYLYESENRY